MIKGKRIAIIGFGKEGVSCANFLGQENEISIFDQKTKNQIDPTFFKKLKVRAKFYLGSNTAHEKFDVVVRSPGVRPDNPLTTTLSGQETLVTSITKIFFDVCPCPVIGVTGTKGKGTTSTLIYKMLKSKYKKVYLAGNIGLPALDILGKLDRESIVILELSSFQLMDLEKSPHVAVVLMITQEHQDWHLNVREYQKAKEPILAFQNSSDFAVINYDYPSSKVFSKKTKGKVFFFSTKEKTNGAYLKNGNIISKVLGIEETICKVSDVFLPGRHNAQNVLAACAAVKIYKIPNERIKKVLKSFRGLKYRLQLVKEINGIKFYNDSFSTTPETTIAAIEAFTMPKVLIIGGSSKKSNFLSLAKKIYRDQSIRTVVLIGREASRIKKAILTAGGNPDILIDGPKTMKEIVELAYNKSSVGDIVILSPACGSFDMFKNYADRGDQFTRAVLALKK